MQAPCEKNTNDAETAMLLSSAPTKPKNSISTHASACVLTLLIAAGLSTAVLYFTGLVQCWMLLGGADPAAWWNDAVENQDLGSASELQSTNCSVCISAAPLVFQGCPFDEVGFYILSGFAAAVPNFILCAVLVSLCMFNVRGRIAQVRRGNSGGSPWAVHAAPSAEGTPNHVQ